MGKKTVILRVFAYILVAAMFLFGLLIFTYPLLSGYVSEKHTETYITAFKNKKNDYNEAKQEENKDNQTDSTEKENNGEDNFANDKKYQNTEELDELYQEMQRYNTNIYKNHQEGLCDAWSYEQSSIDLSEYGINGAVGVLRVPKMSNLEMPIFLGASRNNMSNGAVQLGQTSMPIGGNNTNCVLAGHRGWNGARYFLDIEQMEIGDMVYIENFWDTLSYRVTEIKIIYPDDIDEILIQENKDMVTLITCHPYWASTYRYVVFCTRTKGGEDVSQQQTDVQINSQAKDKNNTYQTETAVIENDGTSETRIFIERLSYVIIPLMLIALLVMLNVVRRKK